MVGLSINIVLSLNSIRTNPNSVQEETKTNTLTNANNVTHIGLLIHREIKDSVGLKKCPYCSSAVRMASDNQAAVDIIIHLVLTSTPECQLEYIYERLTPVLRRNVKLKLNDSYVLMSLALETRPFVDFINETIYSYSTRSNQDCLMVGKSVLVTATCPTIRLDYSEVLSQEKGEIKDYHLSFFENTRHLNNGSSIYLCVHNYFRKVAQLNKASRIEDKQFMFSLNLLIFLYVW